tara:strand:+ start:712 stop:2133 length:1422 start_codon:yes stop_codon:yes gene_type:complete
MIENVVNMNEYKKNANDYLISPFMNKVNDKDFVHTTGVMKILTGVTGQGKTYSTAKVFIPYLAKEKNVDIFVVSVPTTEILDKDDFKKIAFKVLGVSVVDNVKQALHDAELGMKVVLLTTHQAFIVSEKGKEFINYLKNSGKIFSIFIDEAHTWLVSDVNNYKDVNGSSNTTYEATMFKNLDVLSFHSPYIFGLTATPNAEQFGNVKTIGNMTFEVINELPSKKVMLPKVAYFGEEIFYDYNFSTDKFHINSLYEDTITKTFLAPTKIKKTMMVSVGNYNASTGYDKSYVLHITKNALHSQSLVGEDEMVIALMTGEKNETGVYSINDSFQKLDEDEIKKKLNDNNDPLKIVIVVQKGKMGMNIFTLKTLFSFKPQNKKNSLGEAITEFAIQTLGRLVRLNTGIDKDEFANKYEYDLSNYMKTLTDEEKNEVLEANTINVVLPGTNMHKKAVSIFKDKYVSSIQTAKLFYLDN